MAAGLFGNIYDTQTAQQNQLAAEARGTGQGWTAMTTAARELGGAIGSGVGKAFGGVTPQEQKMAELEKIASSMPDFDPTDPEQMKEMSSKYWTGGFYDEGLAMLKESYEMQKVDALMQYYKDQGAAALLNAIPTDKSDAGVSKSDYDIALALVQDKFNEGWFNFFGEDLPEGATEEGIANYIVRTAKNKNLSFDDVINRIISGDLQFIQGTTASSQAPAGGIETEKDASVTLPPR